MKGNKINSSILALLICLMFSCGVDSTSETKVEEKADKETTTETVQKQVIETTQKQETQTVTKVDSTYARFWCSIEILKKTHDTRKTLDASTVALFLATFNNGCATNVEYSEWSNELLFEVAMQQPSDLVVLLIKNSSLDKDLIIRTFENPIHDNIDLDKVIQKIEQAATPHDIKEEILAALNVAKDKL